MAAGLSASAKRGRTRRFLYRTYQDCQKLFPDAVVKIHGERYVSVHKNADAIRQGYANCLSIQLSWGNMSNGESVGTVLLNGTWPGWGDWETKLREAYNKL